MNFKHLLVLIYYLLQNIECAKILGVFHFPSKSHHILGSTLLKALAKRGHQVTMLSPFPLKEPLENYEDIEITGIVDFKEEIVTQTMMNMHNNTSFYTKLSVLMNMGKIMDERILSNDAMKNLLASGRKFDLVIQSHVRNNAYLALPYLFGASSVIFSTLGATTIINRLTGNSAPYSYVPNMVPRATDEMTFTQRLLNSLNSISIEFYSHCVTATEHEMDRQKYFPTAPSVNELLKNVTLVLVNSHYSIESPRPYLPNMIQVGGLHIEKPKALKGDIEEFMDSAVNGAILFSLGSNARSSLLPKVALEAIIDTFANISYKVLWKFELDDFPNLPKNVKLAKWLPQQDILAHHNLKLFITHGGLLSITEAVYHGVPMVGIPIFGDQESNVQEGVNKGYMVRVDLLDLTKTRLSAAINEVLSNSNYSYNIKRRSLIFKDQPMKPLDTAIYWVEYVIRHKGAHHLRSGATKLWWYQYYLVDVATFLIAVAVMLYTIGRSIFPVFIKLLQFIFNNNRNEIYNGPSKTARIARHAKIA